MCPPVSPHKGAFIVQSPHMICDFCMETPLRGRSGGHAGAAPTVSFGWIALALRVSFGWVMRANALNPRGRMVVGRIKPVGLVLLIAQGWRRKEPTLGKGGGRKPMPSALYFLLIHLNKRNIIRKQMLSAKLSVGTGFAYMWGKTNYTVKRYAKR